MDKIVWKDKDGWHVMVGNPERIEEKRKEIEDRLDRQDNRKDHNDTVSVIIVMSCVLLYVIYMIVV